MGRRKEPLKLLESKGKSHLSEAEKAERAAGEVKTPEVKQVRAPDWLPEDLRKPFNEISRQLVSLEIFCKLDRDVLARYLLAHQAYMRVLSYVQQAISEGDETGAVKWSSVHDRYFRQCRECANDLGLSITSRCRLTLPEGSRKSEETAFDRMLREREERQRRA